MKIDVILPTYNRRVFLPRAIECICQQTFRDWRLLVVNDGGEDVADVVSGFDDDRIVYFNRPHAGKAAQLNFALSQAQAPYIAYMDDDDDVFPEHLEKLLSAAERVGADFVYSDTYLTILDADGEVASRTVENGEDAPYGEIRVFNRINHKQVLHARELGKRIGGYDETMRILIDFDFIKRLAGAARRPFHLREVTGEHFLRTDPGTGAFSSISGLWEKDPEAAGRSLLAFFAKDPAALTTLYRSAFGDRQEIARLRRKLGRTLSARWRKLFRRKDAVPAAFHDALPAEGDWREVAADIGTFFRFADETVPQIAAVNAIADGDRTKGTAALAFSETCLPYETKVPRFEAREVSGGLRFRHLGGRERRWVVLMASEILPEEFAVEFDYIPHAVFREQLQFDFGMSSLGDRLRFMVRSNAALVFNAVAGGRFPPDVRQVPFSFPMEGPTRIRIECRGGVASFFADGCCVLSLSADGRRMFRGHAALVFYEDGSERPIDFEIRAFKFFLPR